MLYELALVRRAAARPSHANQNKKGQSMKVNVDIERLERKIALHWHLRLYGGGCIEDQEYHRGCLDAYSDMLCGYLGIIDANEIIKFEEKCYKKHFILFLNLLK